MQSKKKPIVVVGSINADFVVTAEKIPSPGETLKGNDFQVHFGGKGANQAVAVGRLQHPVEMIGMVGTDQFGPLLREGLRAAGVGIQAVESVEGPSGVATISVAHTGENAIIIVPGANGKVTPDFLDKHRQLIRNAGVVLTQLEIPIETVEHLVHLCEQHHVPIILDPAPARILPASVLKRVQWFTPNETEAGFYLQHAKGLAAAEPEQIAIALHDLGLRAVALKLGSKGVLLSNSGRVHRVSGFKVDAVDTTAAGDAFNGAFATGLMSGMPEAEAATFACGAAALSVMRQGAQASLPTLQQVQAFLTANPPDARDSSVRGGLPAHERQETPRLFRV